jgi:hypothetical protein
MEAVQLEQVQAGLDSIFSFAQGDVKKVMGHLETRGPDALRITRSEFVLREL